MQEDELFIVAQEYYAAIQQNSTYQKVSKFSQASFGTLYKRLLRRYGYVAEKLLQDYLLYTFYSLQKQGIAPTFTNCCKEGFYEWENRPEDWYETKEWFKQTNKIFFKAKQSLNLSKVFQMEERLRGKWFNTEKHLAFCMDNTSLADPESYYCRRCKYLGTCKSLLENNNAKLFESRWN